MNSQRIAHTALYLAIALVLPIGFHQFGLGGRIFLPMHIPVLVCGFVLGPFPAVLVGLMAPLLSHLLTSMPPGYAVPLMTLELPLYGLVAGLAYYKMKINIYVALVVAMIAGRLMFALGLVILGLFMELPYGAVQFFAAGGAVVSGLPGIVIQLILVPPVVAAIRRTMRPLPKA